MGKPIEKEVKQGYMKKVLMVLVVATGLLACNENGTVTKTKTDSLRKELDTLGRKIDTTAEKVWDSTKAKAKDLKEKIKDELKDVKIKRNDTTRAR